MAFLRANQLEHLKICKGCRCTWVNILHSIRITRANILSIYNGWLSWPYLEKSSCSAAAFGHSLAFCLYLDSGRVCCSHGNSKSHWKTRGIINSASYKHGQKNATGNVCDMRSERHSCSVSQSNNKISHIWALRGLKVGQLMGTHITDKPMLERSYHMNQ